MEILQKYHIKINTLYNNLENIILIIDQNNNYIEFVISYIKENYSNYIKNS